MTSRWAVVLALFTGCGPCGQKPAEVSPKVAEKALPSAAVAARPAAPAGAAADAGGPANTAGSIDAAASPDAGTAADAGASPDAEAADGDGAAQPGSEDAARSAAFAALKANAAATVERLEGKPLGKAEWTELAAAFAVAEYAEGPVGMDGDPAGQPGDWNILDGRADDSTVEAEGKPPADIAARALALLPAGLARELAAPGLAGLRATLADGEPGWLLGACGHRAIDQSGENNQRVQLLAWVSDKRALPIYATLTPAGEVEASACSRPKDVVDVDGDGTAEVVLIDGYHEGQSLSLWQLVEGQWVMRFSGGGSGL